MKNRIKIALARTWLGRWARAQLNYRRRVKPALDRQLRLTRAAPPQSQRRIRVLAPLIETSHYRFYHYLLLAKALEFRGAQIEYLLCGALLDGCELKSAITPRLDPCLECRVNRRAVVPHFGIKPHSLIDMLTPGFLAGLRAEAEMLCGRMPQSHQRHGVDIMPIVNDSVTRYFYGAVPEDGDAGLRAQRIAHIYSTLLGLEVAHQAQRRWQPELVFSYSTAYSAWAPYYAYFRAAGVPVVNISSTQFDYRAVNFNAMDLYLSDQRFRKYLESRGGRPLAAAEERQLDEFVDVRFSGRGKSVAGMRFFDADAANLGPLVFDPGKRNVFLFSNVFWDVGLSEMDALFSGVIEWVMRTIEDVVDQPGCHLYIKTHPGERYDGAPSLKGVVDYIQERFPVLPSNVTIITPEMRVNPYQLIPHAHAAIVFTGTLGIEMMLGDVPVIACGAAPYIGPGLAAAPRTLAEYRDMVLGKVAVPPPDRERLRLFAYFYFIKHQIPWTLTDQVFGHDFRGFSISNLDDLLPGHDRMLDHLCDCILDPNAQVAEDW